VSDDTDNIVRPVFGGPRPETEIKGFRGHCRHDRYEVDTEKRIITCSREGCGAVLDPFDIHVEYAMRERTYRHYRKEVSEATTKLAELKAEETRVKARTKAASRKDAGEAVAVERAKTERMRAEVAQNAADVVRLCRRIVTLALTPDEQRRAGLSEIYLPAERRRRRKLPTTIIHMPGR
jgi:transcription initiation factor TFIIIB Brf1 subunit/transcription initiation factor TFIIB